MTTPHRSALAQTLGTFPTAVMVDASDRTPLHSQIYRWYQGAIADGRLRPGQPVPSTRALAMELQVSRAPVLAAFEQLIAEGYFEATVGSGTRVSRTIPESGTCIAGATSSVSAAAVQRRVSHRASAMTLREEPWLAHAGPFRVSLPALDQFPAAIWGALVARHARSSSLQLMGYGDPLGHFPLREAIAQYLGAARGVRCTPAQVMIVSGSQQGLQIAARVLLDRGDALLMEEPGYPGAHAAFLSEGVSLIPVPVDAEGLDIEEGARLQPEARAAYVTPSHQYPLGVAMSAARRMKVLAWARDRDGWIIEDDYDSEFRFGARPMPSLQGLDGAERVVYVGTFSKVMFPALRTGYLVLPEDVIAPFRAVRDAMDIFPSTPVQAALADFIVEGHFARHLRRMRVLYEGRRRCLIQGLAGSAHDHLRVAGIEAGMHVTALLPEGHDDMELAVRAGKLGISAIPLSTCCLKEPREQGLILGYGNADDAALIRGVEALAPLLSKRRS